MLSPPRRRESQRWDRRIADACAARLDPNSLRPAPDVLLLKRRSQAEQWDELAQLVDSVLPGAAGAGEVRNLRQQKVLEQRESAVGHP